MALQNSHSNQDSAVENSEEPKAPPRMPSTPLGGPGGAEQDLRYREALELWLRWNEAHEQAVAQLFSADLSPQQIEDFLDSIDQLRREAITMSRLLLG